MQTLLLRCRNPRYFHCQVSSLF